MKFMVMTSLRSQDEEKILPLVAEERAHVQMLREQGVIETLYMSTDRWHFWLVIQGESQSQVQKDLESFPLYPYMDLTITPLLELEY